jgi:hypothetical protein
MDKTPKKHYHSFCSQPLDITGIFYRLRPEFSPFIISRGSSLSVSSLFILHRWVLLQTRFWHPKLIMPFNIDVWNTFWTAVGALSGFVSALPVVGAYFVRLKDFWSPPPPPHPSEPSEDIILANATRIGPVMVDELVAGASPVPSQ